MTVTAGKNVSMPEDMTWTHCSPVAQLKAKPKNVSKITMDNVSIPVIANLSINHTYPHRVALVTNLLLTTYLIHRASKLGFKLSHG